VAFTGGCDPQRLSEGVSCHDAASVGWALLLVI
jgi:hypothetical protein